MRRSDGGGTRPTSPRLHGSPEAVREPYWPDTRCKGDMSRACRFEDFVRPCSAFLQVTTRHRARSATGNEAGAHLRAATRLGQMPKSRLAGVFGGLAPWLKLMLT